MRKYKDWALTRERKALIKNTHCRCVFPSATEQEVGTIPGPQPGTALRVRAECSHDGYVRLEQLAHDRGLGWYVQKTITIPAEMLKPLMSQLRKADCLMPRQASSERSNLLLPVPALRLNDDQSVRREA